MGFNIGEFHERCAKSHLGLADEHAQLAKHHGKLAIKSTGDDCHKNISESHSRIADNHADLADHHTQAAKVLGPGIDMNDDSRGIDPLRAAAGGERFGMLAARDADELNKLMPTNVHGVLPDIPSSARLIARPGGSPINSEEDLTEKLDKAILGG
jgi:hypothetical protein